MGKGYQLQGWGRRFLLDAVCKWSTFLLPLATANWHVSLGPSVTFC